MKTALKVALGIMLAGILMIGGCMALVGGAASEAGKEIQKDHAEHSITVKEFKSLKVGDRLKDVEKRLGEPQDRQTMELEGVPDTVHIYYNADDGELGDTYQINFSNNRLDGKSRF